MNEEDYKYIIREMYNSIRDNSTVVHIGDLICEVLDIDATFLPSGEIIEH